MMATRKRFPHPTADQQRRIALLRERGRAIEVIDHLRRIRMDYADSDEFLRRVEAIIDDYDQGVIPIARKE